MGEGEEHKGEVTGNAHLHCLHNPKRKYISMKGCAFALKRSNSSASNRALVLYLLLLQCYVNLLFWYQFFCGFSGNTMIDYWQMIFFNLFFTSLPPLVFGVLDRDVSAETLLSLPELYKNGQNSEVSLDS